MKIKPGKTYWAANGTPLYCDHMLASRQRGDKVDRYRMIDLTDSTPFAADSSGFPVGKSQGFRVTTKLHYKMAVEIVNKIQQLAI